MESSGAKAFPLNRLLAEADFVSLHAPLTKETRNLIDMAALRRMKATAYLINTARDELVDEEALYEGLTQNLIAGAALDVFTKEPPIGNPLLKLPNVVATPDMGAHSLEAITNVSIFAARSIVQAFQTGEPLHRVILSVCPLGRVHGTVTMCKGGSRLFMKTNHKPPRIFPFHEKGDRDD